ncbi:hypothetical protein LTR91_025386 [Friedmanniomyces endolithicus]|uniref:DNA polymerase lambda n=1 Tax=Friedmanniomyces endolithicus TaxID=329885 RepID=A0AAN6H2E8_9PEZI|nr:hypothetical protein LTR59_015846 [Friedmanniomyces endolithicus]KAK0779382.1 hypothetical protein LTR75_015363 [Friedmanniomyces endolithicus]KAK0779980.1 hypothetical protein LTR38_014245 [Friedmanniomyces endolithicus]KAK0831820.1 hypothetical protein LTR03_015424 [Friedmanniomyces endolithicus]KAK0844041.1 hypothetical protein LTS02_015854 [Friedmanniomyces endolithicus]
MSVTSVEKHLQEKRAFYASLDGALADSDDEPDPGRTASVNALRNASKNHSGHHSRKVSSGLPRSASDTNLVKEPLPRFNDLARVERPETSNGRAPPRLIKSATITGVPSEIVTVEAPVTAIPKMSRSMKRKRDGTTQLVPEAQQIFKGMHFYFFPSDDKNPARAMRMMKAIEFGATWQKDWTPDVTHVIADKLYNLATLTKHLELNDLPHQLIVVNENYPADCIAFRTVVNPRQKRFRVKGDDRPEVTRPEVAMAAASSAEQQKSLELKPAGRSVMARAPESPKTTDEAASSQRVASTRVEPMPPVSDDRNERSATCTTEPQVPNPDIDSTAEFDAAVRQAKDLQYVPLDEESEDASRPTSSEGPTTDDEEERSAGLIPVQKRKAKYQNFQDKFQCMQKHSAGSSDGPNATTITILQQMADYYGKTGDEWRIRAYRKAIGTLRNHPVKISTREEALALPQIGERLACKIEEIATTNRLRRLDNVKAEPNDQILQTFMQVYGAGLAKASEWVAQGYKTLDELLGKACLTENQRIGIHHYEDFNSRIPRAEVKQHGDVVRQALHNIDPAFEVIVGGSYRRGASTSGDIDCLITRPDTSSTHLRAVVLEQLIQTLTASGFLVASLASIHKDDGSKWHGASCLPGRKTWRRIDLLLVPSDELGAALIYFTGNDIFNRSMRLLASTKGMRLNQRGLYKGCLRGHGREKLSEGTLVEGRDEKRIFEVLGVPWRMPEHRIC